jgi:mRNA interferase MazF
MVAPQIGAVVVVPFPFSDLSNTKLRPALVLAASGRNDWICLQITSNPYSDPRAIELDQSDFSSGSLRRVSFARPGKLFTAHVSLFQRVAGVLREETLASIRDMVIDLLRQPKDPVVSP